ncbi:hypothetical protein cand_024440 [Cryptosporidium andersoni]|uniref:Protein kinase domain-containing protein n=1 Tax=Cryptosporidium andersoni TaxID=117008 RepID=A0A1J4MVG1_9CRYT|nr:hypothetical protein cand_024440 [Cryptosporidium andersoni]
MVRVNEKPNQLDDGFNSDIKGKIVSIPLYPLKPQTINGDDPFLIQINEVIALDAIYGNIIVHNGGGFIVPGASGISDSSIQFSSIRQTYFDYKNDVDYQVYFIPKEVTNSELTTLDIKDNCLNSELVLYSLVLSRNASDSVSFKNRRYWRRNHIFARLSVCYPQTYPVKNPTLIFEFSFELPESILNKLEDGIVAILCNRSRNQECIFQVLEHLEVVLDDLCNYLQLSEDLWEQMRRVNYQKEFEKHLESNNILKTTSNDMTINTEENPSIASAEDIDPLSIRNFVRFSEKVEAKLFYGRKSNIESGPLDDALLGDPESCNFSKQVGKCLKSDEISQENDLSVVFLEEDISKDEGFLLSSRFYRDFQPLNLIYKSDFVLCTSALHQIDQNIYHVIRYKIPSILNESMRDVIFSRISSLAMLQHRCITRYYQCWIESTFDKKTRATKNLFFFIQSESLGNSKTLYEEVFKGRISHKEPDIIWSLIRQLLELFSYCHKKDVYHMALSSKCVYLNSDLYGFSIKVSNFLFGSSDMLTSSWDHLTKDSTSIFKSFSKENAIKYDLYCIGIIFIEMWTSALKIDETSNTSEYLLQWILSDKIQLLEENCNSASENEERGSKIDHYKFSEIPSVLCQIPKSALIVMYKLLHKEDTLKSANEILRSTLLPCSVDKASFELYLSMLNYSDTYESNITMNTLFSRYVDDISSAAFLFDIQQEEKLNLMDLTINNIVKTNITDVLQTHGFIPFSTPLLYPASKSLLNYSSPSNFEKLLIKSKYRTRNPHLLLDISNTLLALPVSIPDCIASMVSTLFEELNSNSNPASGTTISNNLNTSLSMDSIIQRYNLQSIYEQPKSDDKITFGPPRSNLGLTFDVLLFSQESEPLTDSDCKKYLTNSGISYEILLTELETLLLSIRLIIPWMNYWEDTPIVRWTYPPLILALIDDCSAISSEKSNSRSISNQITSPHAIYENMRKDSCIHLKDSLMELKQILGQKFVINWEPAGDGTVRLNNIFENLLYKKLQNYIKSEETNNLFKMLTIAIEVMTLTSGFISDEKTRAEFIFDPLMEYDKFTYDVTGLIYIINSNRSDDDIIYAMGGRYDKKLQNSLNQCSQPNSSSLSQLQSLQPQLNYYNNFDRINNPQSALSSRSMVNNTACSSLLTSVYGILGEIAIELIMKNTSEMARSHSIEFRKTGGLINGISYSQVLSKHTSIAISSSTILIEPLILLQSCYPKVVVVTQKNKLQLLVLSLARQLWLNGIRCEYRLAPVQYLSTFVDKLKKGTLVELLVVVMKTNKPTTNSLYNTSNISIDEDESVVNSFTNNSNFTLQSTLTSNASEATIDMKSVSFRLESIASPFHEINMNGGKIILESEEEVINYIHSRRRK